MQRIFISLVLVALQTLVSATTNEICCCPDIAVYLKCTDKNDDREPAVKTSFLKANGYVCDALDNTDVTLECNVVDVKHEAVKTVKYFYYKAYKIPSGRILAYDRFNAKKLTACDEAKSTCTLQGVKWSGEVYSPAKFENFDNFLYQCLVEVTLIDDTKFELPSNTMMLDIYKDEPKPDNYVIRNEEKRPLNTGKAYEKLTCGSDDFSDRIPSTNPRTRAKWSFKGIGQTEWTELNIPKHPRMGLVGPVVADESKSFHEGTLLLMLFDPIKDTGHYRCDVEYVTTTVGKNQTYQRAEYKITGNGQEDMGYPQTKMLSAITSDAFTLKGRHVDFTCYARDTNASVADTFQWEYDYNGDTDVPVDISIDLFKGVTILNHGRTLRLPSEYKYYGYKFKCRVTEGVKNIVSQQFEQPVIVPEEMYIPIDTRSCSNPGSAIELSPNKALMMSDRVNVTDPVQVLSGAVYGWMTNAAVISPFQNIASEGGINDEDKLKITDALFTRHFAGTSPDQKCRYFTFFQTRSTRSSGYQLPEVLKLTRPSDNSCADLDCSVSEVNVKDINCKESKFTITVGGTSPQCLSVEVKAEDGTSVYKNSFAKVAPSCSTRKLEMTITKDSMDVKKLEGKYTVIVTPEDKTLTGCSSLPITIDCGQEGSCSKPTIQDGYVSPATATIDSGAQYTAYCDPGFTMTPTVTCTDGQLSTVPTCAAAAEWMLPGSSSPYTEDVDPAITDLLPFNPLTNTVGIKFTWTSLLPEHFRFEVLTFLYQPGGVYVGRAAVYYDVIFGTVRSSSLRLIVGDGRCSDDRSLQSALSDSLTWYLLGSPDHGHALINNSLASDDFTTCRGISSADDWNAAVKSAGISRVRVAVYDFGTDLSDIVKIEYRISVKKT